MISTASRALRPRPGVGAVGRLALEGEDDRKDGVAAAAVARPEAAAAVVVDDGVHVVEQAGPDHVRPADDRSPRPASRRP